MLQHMVPNCSNVTHFIIELGVMSSCLICQQGKEDQVSVASRHRINTHCSSHVPCAEVYHNEDMRFEKEELQ